MLDIKTKAKLKKILARTVLTGDSANEQETIAAFNTARNLLKKHKLDFTDLLEMGGGGFDAYKLPHELLQRDYRNLQRRYRELESKYDDLKRTQFSSSKSSVAEATAKKDRRVLNKYFAEEAVKKFVSELDYFGEWISTRELHYSFIDDFPDCKALSITKFSLLIQKFLRKKPVMGGEKSCSKGFII